MTASKVRATRYTRAQAQKIDKHRKQRERKTDRIADVQSKEVIVWDGEGMKLSGDDKPQHYVLFGCSAEPDSPLVINRPKGRLEFEQLADYCLRIAQRHPNAVHFGYYFRYDQNMIIWSLPWLAKEAIYHKNACVVKRGVCKYYVKMIPGKYTRITRVNTVTETRVSILIEDIAAFFASSFVSAYESLFPVPTDPDNWTVVKQGKADRSVMMYSDLATVQRYWRAEILALRELAVEFRRLMFEAEFYLKEWYGPGALANYIRRDKDLIKHEWGGKEANIPPAVHEACKGAFFGGHVEPYRCGYVEGPIHSYDRNSAYPTAFCDVPTLEEGGEWRHVGAVSADEWFNNFGLRTSFGVFKVRWRGTSNTLMPVGTLTIQPLPHRDSKKNISFPVHVDGWYWAPEIVMAMQGIPGRGTCEIVDGWIWKPAREKYWPWEAVFRTMYHKRAKLKKEGNPAQMAFKLGLNSMYGKMAQRAGGDEEAPKSHTLCIAGYVTSSCRAAVLRLMWSCPNDTVISVETDGVFTTCPPEELRVKFDIGDRLGEWTHKVYDAMLMLQNGVYLLKKDGEWLPPKTRGIQASAFMNAEGKSDPLWLFEHLSRCTADVRWEPLEFDGGEAFISLGTAMARASRVIKHGPKKGKRSVNPFKASDLHCTWYPDGKQIDLEGRKSKRSHYPRNCRACQRSETPDQTWHDLVIHSIADTAPWEIESTPYELPWEKEFKDDEWHIDLKESEGTPAAQC
jgi:hypothetical protein